MGTPRQVLSGLANSLFADNLHSTVEPASSLLIFPEGAKSDVSEAPANGEIVVIGHRTLVRDCLVRCLREGLPEEIVSFASVEEFESGHYRPQASALFLLCASGRKSAEVERDWSRLQSIAVTGNVILLADDEAPTCVFSALKGGVKGYIPTSVSVKVAIGAVNLVKAGGVFIPTSCLNSGVGESFSRPAKREIEELFTARQIWVIGEICKGKSNKVIANMLKIEESTVKVHVRNIMRKLKAHSRTEVAFIISKMDVAFA